MVLFCINANVLFKDIFHRSIGTEFSYKRSTGIICHSIVKAVQKAQKGMGIQTR